MFELKRYGENIESMRDKLGVKDKSLKKFGRHSGGGGDGGQSGQKGGDEDGGKSTTNHHSFPPAPVVEVTPSSDNDGPGSYSDADVSSPGTPPSLQIDLDGSGGRDKSPNRGRAMPSGGQSLIGGAIGRTPVPGSLDFKSDGGASSVVVRSPMANSNSKVNRKGMKAGAALSALVSSLTQRKRVATQVGALTPVRQGAAVRGEQPPKGGKGGGGGALNVPAIAQDDAEAKLADGGAVDKTKSPFSSMYEHEKKTGFAVVDPNQKRPKRKTTKMVGGEPPPAKRPRNNNSHASNANHTPTPGVEAGSKSDGHMGDPAALVAKVQEYSSAAISALSTGTTHTNSSPSAAGSTPHTVASLKASARSSMSSSPQNTSGSSSGSGATTGPGGMATLGLPGLPKARPAAGGARKKAGKKGDKRGKSPHKSAKAANSNTVAAALATANAVSSSSASQPSSTVTPSTTAVGGVSSALAALINAPTGATTPTSILSSTPTTTTSVNSLSRSQITNHNSGSTPITATATSTSTTEVRGEAAAPGLSGEEISNFAEGSGLLADTIRKVNTTFLGRLNQMMGPSDDMGYKYFVEKVSV